MRWMYPEVDEDQTAALARALSVHPLVARVLMARGYSTPESANAFLADRLSELPDPLLLRGMTEAVARLARAIRTQEKITLYGDYDVDGVCSTSLLRLFFEELGVTVSTYIPHRLEEGYGLNLPAVERIAADGTRILVTLDCGITSEAEVQRAKDLGLETVIVDHHTVPALLPPAVAVINPHQPGCKYPTKHLCAAGVAFNLCMALRRHLRESGYFAERKEPNLRSLMDLVALATVADVVPLTGANRILVKQGLEELSQAHRPGVLALKEVAGLDAQAKVTAGQVGFRLGPRINAAGRLDDASMGMRLLCSKSLAEARPLAQALDQANAERQGIEQEILAAALKQAESLQEGNRGLVLYGDGWHAGVIGIVASRVVERFHRPTVIIGVKDGVGKGSGRSIEAFHLYDALAGCAQFLTRFGGHKHAAGLTIDADKLPALRETFQEIARNQLTDEDLIPRCRIDAVVRPHEVDETAIIALERLAPFGAGNPEPVLMLRRQSASPRVLQSKTGDGRGHLKLSLESAPKLDVIGFGMADRVGLTEGPVDLAFQASMDEWKGIRKVSCKLKALRTAG